MEAFSSRAPRGNSARADSAAISKPALARAGRTKERITSSGSVRETAKRKTKRNSKTPGTSHSHRPRGNRLPHKCFPCESAESQNGHRQQEHESIEDPYVPAPSVAGYAPAPRFVEPHRTHRGQGGHVQGSVSPARVLAGPEADDLS